MLGHPAAHRKLPDEGAIELAATVLEILETRLAQSELRFLQPTCERAILARELLGYPEGHRCDLIISFGYPADLEVLTRPNRPGGRKRLEEVAHDERWGEHWTEPVR